MNRISSSFLRDWQKIFPPTVEMVGGEEGDGLEGRKDRIDRGKGDEQRIRSCTPLTEIHNYG